MSSIGAHVSAAGGPAEAVARARAMGASCMQIFGSSPRQWNVRELSAAQLAAYEHARGKMPVFLHAPYLINLASPSLVEKSTAAFEGHLRIAEQLKATGVVFHVGSGDHGTREEMYARVAKAVRQVLVAVPGKVPLLMENAASPKKVGADLRELAQLLDLIGEKRMGVCIDTAHAFEAGILDVSGKETVGAFRDEVEATVGVARIALFHANDSETVFGSAHDRHANIGEGEIGKRGFELLCGISEFREKPWILEVPGTAGEGPDAENVRRLRAIWKSCVHVSSDA